MMKKCSRCNRFLSFDCFHKDKNKKDGLQNYCKECHKKYVKEWWGEHYLQKREYYIAKANKRKRDFENIIISPEIPGFACGHHINNILVVCIPKCIHLAYYTGERERHRELLRNHWIYEFLGVDKIVACE
jgi:hypothetical protein